MKKDEKNNDFLSDWERYKADHPEAGPKPMGKFQLAELGICLAAVILGIVYLKTKVITLSVLLPLYTLAFAAITVLRFLDLRDRGEKRFAMRIPAICWAFLTAAIFAATVLYFTGINA